MRDGIALCANVFKPNTEGTFPVVLSATPYSKDKLPDRIGMFLMKLSGVRFGHLDCSRWTGFESPDPKFWTDAGYAVVQFDVRGMHKSQGRAGALTDDDAQDFAEVIEWCSRQPWSSGAVGLCGVSYLAMSQWRVAALRPPALKAIIPWEGLTDMLRELGYQDGVRESLFVWFWWKMRMRRGHNKSFPMKEDFLKERDARPLDDEWWSSKRAKLDRIVVPALVCASWSDHGLHTRGSLLGFERIASQQKWLFTHGRRKWETFYGNEARTIQLRFFDHFLKGLDNGWQDTPRVRLEVRSSQTKASIRGESDWPLRTVSYVPMYLDASTSGMHLEKPTIGHSVKYATSLYRSPDRASFRYRFPSSMELTGSMTLKLWVSSSEGTDLDLFVKLRKFDGKGKEVFFYGYNGFDRDGVAKGWLRASHRELDPQRSRLGLPWHTHRTQQFVQPGEVIPVEIEVLASSTFFEAGSTLQLDVLGKDADLYPGFRHRPTVNRGWHSIHTGERWDSYLLVPRVDTM